MNEFEQEVSASGAVLAGFAAVVAALLATMPPTAIQLSSSDPLVQLVARGCGLASIPLVSVIPALGWWTLRRPDRSGWRRPARQTLWAFAAVAIAFPLLRLMVGPTFPAFIPPEESARPGMALGLSAALLEEGVFRLGLLAVLHAVLVRRASTRRVAAVGSVVVTALVLALVHELGPGGVEFHAPHFASRFLVLGCFMGALFVWAGPVFLVAGHSAAHVAIPLLFPG